MPALQRKVGLARQYINSHFQDVPENCVLNGHILMVYYANGSSLSVTQKKLNIELKNKIRISRLVRQIEQYKKLSNVSEFERFKSVCNEPFEKQNSSSTPKKSAVKSSSKSSCNTLPHTLPHCATCHKVRHRLKHAIKLRAAMHKKHVDNINNLRASLRKRQCTRVLNQKIKRKDETIKKLREQSDHKERNSEVLGLKRKCRRFKVKLEKKTVPKSDSPLLKEEMKDRDNYIKVLENKVAELETVQEQSNSSKSEEDRTRLHSYETRMFVYDSVVNQVPTANIPTLLDRFFKRIGATGYKVPHRTTVEQMTRELGIISDIQTADRIINNSDLTLGFDATTQEGVHINSIHITFKESCLVCAVDQLPGGCATDYKNHICSTVDHMALIYSAYKKEDYQTTRNSIIGSIRNTMTDRVNVNHATIRLVTEAWGTSLNELNCHLHPLDTIATSCRSALKSVEVEKGKLYGADCKAANVVLQLNKMRFKDGKGDPQGFKTFLHDNGLPLGFIPRYRGNRLHVLFHLTAKYFAYQSAFKSFLQSGPALGGLRASLYSDFVLVETTTELQVLGLLGKYLTGPWMKTFYTSHENETNHIDGINIVRGVVNQLQTQLTDCMTTLTRDTNYFGQPIDTTDGLLQVLRTTPDDTALFMKMMTACLNAIATVLQRQYARYFSIDITEKLRDEAASARSHNIDAEEVMGMFSAAQKRSPNATLSFLSSKMRAQKNNVIDYLESFPREEQENIIRFAVSSAQKLRQRQRKTQQDITKELSRRTVEKAEKKNKALRSKLEKRLKQVNPDQLHTEFPELSGDQAQDIGDILRGYAIGREIRHVWYDADPREKTVYSGKLEKLKKGTMYVIGYWEDGQSYDDAEDYVLSKYELAADLLQDDLILL